MEVTRTNFRNLLPELTYVINDASFICLDGEFTGLNTGNNITSYDTPSQYYHKLKEGAMDFLFFQFGLAAFKYDKSKDKFTHTAYNFYLFPRPHHKNAKDVRFMCQSSSIDFLGSQGFDFNKVFREGIPYLSDPDEQEVREQLAERRKAVNTSNNDTIQIPEDLKSTVENACQQIQQFLESNKEEQEIMLEKPNSFVRRLVYQEFRERFSPDDLALETKNYALIVRRIHGKEQRLQEEEEKRDREESEIEDAVGFTHVVRLLSKSGKMIVGHNLLLDILHIVRQFFVPLPDSYEEFKELLHNIFPVLIDTKYMCSAPPFKDILSTTVLMQLLRKLKEPPFSLPDVDCEEGKGYKSVDLKHHEAGFDAYMTGLVFLSLSNFIRKTQVGTKKDTGNFIESSLLRPYINRLLLMRIQDTHICLEGNDPSPLRDHVFLLTFPKDWQYRDINELFSPYGSIFISWIDDTSAWISLQKKEQAINVKKCLLNNINRPNVTLTHYNDYIRRLETGSNLGGLPKNVLCGNKLYDSPATSAARKRRIGGQESVNNLIDNRRSKRESLGRQRSSLSGIPEEADESPASPKSKAKQQCTKICVEELVKDESSRKKKKLQFEENDSWD